MKATILKLATVLGIAGAIVLSVPSAEARNGRNAAMGLGVAGGLALGAASAASQPYGDRYYRGTYAYEPAYGAYDSYNYYSAPRGYYDAPAKNRITGTDRNGQIPGTNYNPNQ